MKTIKCFRFVKEDLTSESGSQSWKVGEWVKLDSDRKLELCHWGFHACRTPLQSLNFVCGSRWFIAEARGELVEDNEKLCALQMRIIKELPVKKIAVEFAIACAMRVIKIYEKEYPKDDRPRKAIEAAKAYLKNPTKTLREAARSAAWSAESAARSAAESAAESAAWSAAWSAAESAARSAWSAAWSAARSAARSAWSAARSAAWSAARSAESAARSAAESAAWSAARSAARSAWSAEKIWQEKALNKIIKKYLKEGETA